MSGETQRHTQTGFSTMHTSKQNCVREFHSSGKLVIYSLLLSINTVTNYAKQG